MRWKKQPHSVFGKGGREESIHTLIETTFPKWQWTSGKYSIIEPSDITDNDYELYDGENCHRFDTLKEAKQEAELLNQKL